MLARATALQGSRQLAVAAAESCSSTAAYRGVMAAYQGEQYDVFLCHRGPDTKIHFSVWLKRELEGKKLQMVHARAPQLPGLRKLHTSLVR
eukprot:jgi/Chlat1/3609/Chrsp235S03606